MSTIGNGRTLPMTGWLLPWLKKNLIYCPELVDHYITGVRCWPFFAYEAWHLRVSYREKQSFKIEGSRATHDPKQTLTLHSFKTICSDARACPFFTASRQSGINLSFQTAVYLRSTPVEGNRLAGSCRPLKTEIKSIHGTRC